MIAMMGTFALFLMAIFSVARKGICTLLALLAILHVLIADYLFMFDGTTYYLSAGIAAGIGAVVIINNYHFTKFTRDIMIILGCQIVVNLGGWYAYEEGYTPDLYNAVSGAFYLALIIRLLYWTKSDGKQSAAHRYISGIHKPYSVGVSNYMESRK